MTWPFRSLLVGRVILWRHHEIAGHLVVTQEEETMQLLLRSPRTELFELVEFYSEDGLEMDTCHEIREILIIVIFRSPG